MASRYIMVVVASTLLLSMSCSASAQQKRGEASKEPTAGIEAPARPASSLNYQRSPVQDSVLAGGNFGNLPGWSGTLPSPCEINPELTGCGGDTGGEDDGGGGGNPPLDPCIANPAAPGCGGDGGGGDDPIDPCIANPAAPGCDGDGGGNPPPKMVAVLWSYNQTVVDGGDGGANISYPGAPFSGYYCSERDANGRDCNLSLLYSQGAPNTTQWAEFCQEGDEYWETFTPTGVDRGQFVTTEERIYLCSPAP